jgi:hypothetical protein
MTEQRMSWQNVLDELMLEEDAPTSDALARWQNRYPQYRNELAAFFESWAARRAAAEGPDNDPIDEEKLSRRGVEFAMNMLRKQGRIVDPVPAANVKPFDQLVLTAVYLLRGQGDDMAIADKVSTMQGEEANLGAIFESLSRLQRNGFISPWNSDPKTEPDGTSKRYFTVMLAGEHALAEARATSRVVADALGEFA